MPTFSGFEIGEAADEFFAAVAVEGSAPLPTDEAFVIAGDGASWGGFEDLRPHRVGIRKAVWTEAPDAFSRMGPSHGEMGRVRVLRAMEERRRREEARAKRGH